MHQKSVYSIVALGALASCAAPAPEEVSQVARSALRCDLSDCGANAGTVGDGLFFDEMDSSGKDYNWGGIRLADATAPDGRRVQVHVEGDRLVAVAAGRQRGVTVTYTGVGLRGTALLFQHVSGAEYRVVIADVFTTSFWAGQPGDLPAYLLVANKIRSGDPALLPLGENQDPVGAVHVICAEHLDTDPNLSEHAVVFQGDRIDTDTKKVTLTDPADPWFSLGCAGTAMAKMHLLRHTTAGTDPSGPTAPVEQRQAMLKMLTADYCGTGQSFTVNGHPLNYMDAAGIYLKHPVDVSDLTHLEAIWGPQGAICINSPRMFPLLAVETSCGRLFSNPFPSCNAVASSWASAGYVVSGNPP